MPLQDHPEFRLCLQTLVDNLREDRQTFLDRPPLMDPREEVYDRGLLQGKVNLLEQLVELAKEDFLNRQEEENGRFERHDRTEPSY